MKNDMKDEKTGYHYIGKNYPIHDAYEKVTGRAEYTVDMRPHGMLFGKMLFSPIAHAKILSIDVSEAEKLQGVRYIATCMNTSEHVYNSAQRYKGHKMKPDEQVFPKIVRYVGDRVAAVAADTAEIAEKAAKLIKVEYEELPFVLDVEEALREDAPEIHEGGNLLGTLDVNAGNVQKALAESDYVIEGRYSTPIVHHYAMEPHVSMADFDGKNLTVWTSAQNIFAFRLLLSEIYNLPVNRVRVIRPTVGGGFGGKYEMVVEPVAACLAIHTKKPVLVELSRKDSMISTRTRHGAVVYLKTGFNQDGTINAIDYKEIANAGAYAGSTMNVLGGASAKSMMLYHAPNIHFLGLGVYTNLPVAGAMRGYGSPQIETPLELQMEKIAKQLHMDPVELRMKNLVQPGDINPAKKISLGNCRVRECLEKGKEMIGWTETVETSEDGRFRTAIGCSCGVHGNGVAGIMIDTTGIELKMTEDGGVFLFTGNQDIGQGNVVVLKLILAETLDLDPENIVVIDADTTNTPFDMGTFSSRCTWVSGEALRLAAEEFKQMLYREASELLEVEADRLQCRNGCVVSLDDPFKSATFAALALHAQLTSRRGELVVNRPYYSEHNPGSYSADFAKVRVDMQTGEVRVLDFAAVHDVGRAINPMLLSGQIEGGVQMGLGYGLSEELLFDPASGKPLNALTKKYKMFKAADMPPIKIGLVEDGEPFGPYGAKSIGEIATVAVGSAVANAVNRALGAHISDLPISQEKIKKFIDPGTKE